MPDTVMHRTASVTDEITLLRERAAQFRLLATTAPLGQRAIGERLLAAAADLDTKAQQLEDGE